jgi:hypothetical protein
LSRVDLTLLIENKEKISFSRELKVSVKSCLNKNPSQLYIQAIVARSEKYIFAKMRKINSSTLIRQLGGFPLVGSAHPKSLTGHSEQKICEQTYTL